MVAGENAEAAGIIRDRFVKTELGRKISDRFLDRGAGAGFSVGVLAREIFLESVVDLLQLAQESFVLARLLPDAPAARAGASGPDCDWSGSTDRDRDGGKAGGPTVPTSTKD